MSVPTEAKDWLLRIGDGDHFHSSSKRNIWGVASKDSNVKGFIKRASPGDHLWFVKSGGQIIAVATFVEFKDRILGPLISLTATNEELGWNKTDGSWDKEVHYKDLYTLTQLNLMSALKSPCVIRLYNEKCLVDLPKEYILIKRYSSVVKAET